MIAPPQRVVVVGGSIAAVTAAESLRLEGFDGEITLLSDESHFPYSRVPLSKGVLGGKESSKSALLPPLGQDINIRLGAQAVALRPDQQRVLLGDGEEVPYDRLIIATGASARRLARPGQVGEHVIRTMKDTETLSTTLRGARSVIVVGGGFLGMEAASTCTDLGLHVTLIDREPPLSRLLGTWLARLVTDAARERGVDFILAPDGVKLVGYPDVQGVDFGRGIVSADVVISAVGDTPNVDWLASSGLATQGGLVVDTRCQVTPQITAAGDVTVTAIGRELYQRSPHWTSAVRQGRMAAAVVLHGDNAVTLRPDPYYWTEQFGLDIKISGEIPRENPPVVLEGDVGQRSALLQWQADGRPVAAVSVNHRLPIVKLKKLGANAPFDPKAALV
jgi:3-phenylpropionate/trans-cinnamate dioxygenase ferredoxin reductase component